MEAPWGNYIILPLEIGEIISGIPAGFNVNFLEKSIVKPAMFGVWSKNSYVFAISTFLWRLSVLSQQEERFEAIVECKLIQNLVYGIALRFRMLHIELRKKDFLKAEDVLGDLKEFASRFATIVAMRSQSDGVLVRQHMVGVADDGGEIDAIHRLCADLVDLLKPIQITDVAASPLQQDDFVSDDLRRLLSAINQYYDQFGLVFAPILDGMSRVKNGAAIVFRSLGSLYVTLAHIGCDKDSEMAKPYVARFIGELQRHLLAEITEEQFIETSSAILGECKRCFFSSGELERTSSSMRSLGGSVVSSTSCALSSSSAIAVQLKDAEVSSAGAVMGSGIDDVTEDGSVASADDFVGLEPMIITPFWRIMRKLCCCVPSANRIAPVELGLSVG